MSKTWIRAKLPEFVRDLFRDFCLAWQSLEEQFGLFDREARVSFEVLRDLVGLEMNKGLLWRLKDTAHHVFRNDPDDSLVGRFLDWGLGYIFHETIKLKEDAYQNLTYGPLFRKLEAGKSGTQEEEWKIGHELAAVVAQTVESMRREIERIRFIAARCRKLLPLYLHRHRDNPLLARLVFSQNDLVRNAFGGDYQGLIAAIWGEEPERMHILASQSLRQGGWMEDAALAMRLAFETNSASERVLREKEIVDNWLRRFKS